MGFLREVATALALSATVAGVAAALQERPGARAAARVAREIRVPELVGRSLTDARQLLGQAKLQLGRVARARSPRARGTVIRQSVPAGSIVSAGATVDVLVAVGAQTDDVGPGEVGTRDDVQPPPDTARRPVDSASVPDLLGHTRLGAGIVLALKKLTLGSTDSTRDDRNAGKVVRQSPPAGTRVPRQTPVDLVFGFGPKVIVPDLRDSTLAGAGRVLEASGLALGIVESVPTDGDGGRVIRQRPAAQQQVSPGDSVRVSVGVRREVKVPDVVDSLFRAAVATLKRAGLTTGLVNAIESDVEARRVLAQHPAAGSVAQPGTAVALDVATPRRLVTVPGLIGSTPTNAIEGIRAAGLSLGQVDSVLRPGAPGLVDSQHPRGGTRVPPGSGVAFRVVAPIPGVSVPSVIDSSLAAATEVLRRDSLHTGPISYVERAGARRRVVAQQPPPGSTINRGAAVQLTIAVPPPPPPAPPPIRDPVVTGLVTAPADTLPTPRAIDTMPPVPPVLLVPNVLHKRLPVAESLLGDVRIAIERIDTAGTWNENGLLLRQSPVGGAAAPRDMVVRVWIGVWPPVWLLATVAGALLGGGAASAPAAVRRIRDHRRRKRLDYRPCYDRGRQTIIEGAESLGRAELHLSVGQDAGRQVVVEDAAPARPEEEKT